VIWAGSEEVSLPSRLTTDADTAAADWAGAARSACGRLVAAANRTDGHSAGRTLLLLPVRRAGISSSLARQIESTLLQSALAMSWSVRDPAVVSCALSDSGSDPMALSAAARLRLTRERLPAFLLLAQASGFETISSGGIDTPLGAPSPLTASVGLPPFALTLRLVDGASGLVVFAHTRYLPSPEVTGIFGVQRRLFLSREIAPVAEEMLGIASQKG